MTPPVPPASWGTLPGLVGQALVWTSLGLFLVSAILRLVERTPSQALWARRAFNGGAVSLFAVFAILFALFLGQQHQYLYVYGHSQNDYELQYKLSGVWAGQEGSILLWSSLTAFFGLLTLRRFGEAERWYAAVYALILAIMVGISAFESPFRLLTDAAGHPHTPLDGKGMSPALLNYWMVIHPPTIFVGFALTAVSFALACSALIRRDYKDWVVQVRPWSLACLGILGLGLCMGGFWAYETLGWGGFWVWDPVENTSFVPWCAMAAFVHGIFVQLSRSKGQMVNLALGAAPFLLFCYGTFLTRSGFLGDTSVHSFAKMDPQAMGILIGLLGVTFLGFLALFVPALIQWQREGGGAGPKEAWTKPSVNPSKPGLGYLRQPKEEWAKTPFNLSSFYGIAMWLLFAFGLVTAIGMSVPLIQSLAGQKPKVVEEPLYNSVLAWFFVPTMLAIGLGPYLTWRGLPFKQLLSRIINPLAVAVMLTGFLLLWFKTGWNGVAADPSQTTKLAGAILAPRIEWVSFLAFLCFFAIVTNGWRLVEMLPRSRWTFGGVLTHAGVGLALLGLIVSRGLEQKELITIHSSRKAEAFGYGISFIGPTTNFMDRNNAVALKVEGDRASFTAKPGLYFRPGPEGPQETIWPHIERRPLYDLYFTLHPMVFEASESMEMRSGMEARYQDMVLKYVGMETEGTPGTDSAKFIANCEITLLGATMKASPSVSLLSRKVAEQAELDKGRTLTLTKVDEEKGGIVLELSSSPKEPMAMLQGSSLIRDGFRFTFLGIRARGTDPSNAALAAELEVQPVLEVIKAAPWMGLEGEGKARISDDYSLVLERIEAANKNAVLRFDFNQPAFPLEVYYKPLTWAVWFGVGVMTIGALASARGRRSSRGSGDPRKKAASPPISAADDASEDQEAASSRSEKEDEAFPAP